MSFTNKARNCHRNCHTHFTYRATNHRALLRKMTYTDKTSDESSSPCAHYLSLLMTTVLRIEHIFIGLFCGKWPTQIRILRVLFTLYSSSVFTHDYLSLLIICLYSWHSLKTSRRMFYLCGYSFSFRSYYHDKQSKKLLQKLSYGVATSSRLLIGVFCRI